MSIARGEMVTVDSGQPMRFVGFDSNGMAGCVVVDDDAVVRLRFVYFRNLRPMRHVFQPRTRWPETSGFDLIEIEKEEAHAAEMRRQQRRAARRSKRSRKIKRRAVPA